MKKTLIVNLNYVDLTGDVLDLSFDESGIIYNISKDVMDEISVDYVDSTNKDMLNGRKYDACTYFFNLSRIFTKRGKNKIIKDVSKYIKKGGKIYLWDNNKKIGEKIDKNIDIVLPNGKIKEGVLKNKNLLLKCNYEEVIKILEKFYKIDETKIWEDMFFIKGTKI